MILINFSFDNRFHQKVGIEKPVIDLKPAHGLANAEPFKMPSLHQLWTPSAYQAFDLRSGAEEKPVSTHTRKMEKIIQLIDFF